MLSIDERNNLIEQHFGHVKVIARRMVSSGIPECEYDDLVQEGVIGLIDAIERYDDERDTTLIGYCEFRIKGAMLDYLRGMDVNPRRAREKSRKREHDIQRFKETYYRCPTWNEMAEFLDISIEEYIDTYYKYEDFKFISLDTYINTDVDGGPLTLMDSITYDEEIFTERLSTKIEMQKVMEKMKAFKERDKQITLLYMIHELTMKEIGELYDLTESRISQIIETVMKKLKRICRKEGD
ncbi:sigma-70 family RNA polymerase sigma factor [Candidatus Pacearchaeota archaeon]|nr:sigma-70 family RNA polymerase sigma factor [Candidatus Pacearchaeota archaeon]